MTYSTSLPAQASNPANTDHESAHRRAAFRRPRLPDAARDMAGVIVAIGVAADPLGAKTIHELLGELYATPKAVLERAAQAIAR